MYFTDEEWLAFALNLRRATDAGRLDWQVQGPWSENVFVVTVPGNAVYRLASRDEDGQFPYVLEIQDLDGTNLSEFRTVAYSNSWDPSPAQNASGMLDALYRDVGRLVTGAPQRAKSLLDGLEELPLRKRFLSQPASRPQASPRTTSERLRGCPATSETQKKPTASVPWHS